MSRSIGDAVAARESMLGTLRRLLPWAAILALAVAVLGADYALGKATLVATYAIAGLGVVIAVNSADRGFEEPGVDDGNIAMLRAIAAGLPTP